MGEPAAGGRSRGAELIIPLCALVFTLYYFYSISDAPWTAKVSTYLIGGILILLVGVFVLRCGLSAAREGGGFGFSALLSPPHLLPQRIALVALTVGYVYALEYGGFTLSTFVYLYIAMLCLGGRRVAWTGLALSALYALGGYLLFIVAFDTRFPRGGFEVLVERMLG